MLTIWIPTEWTAPYELDISKIHHTALGRKASSNLLESILLPEKNANDHVDLFPRNHWDFECARTNMDCRSFQFVIQHRSWKFTQDHPYRRFSNYKNLLNAVLIGFKVLLIECSWWCFLIWLRKKSGVLSWYKRNRFCGKSKLIAENAACAS